MSNVKAPRAVNYTLTAVFAAALFVFLLAAAISLPILNRWFYYIQIKTLGLEEVSGKTYAQIKEAFDLVMDYLLLPGKEFSAGDFKYSADGAAHFADCKPLFVLDVTLTGVCGGIVLILFILHLTKVIRLGSLKGHTAAFWTAIAAVVVPVVLGCAIAADFDKAFEVFHHIFFPGKTNWVFNSRMDEIITVLPEEFFMNCAIFIGVGLVVFCAAIIVADCCVKHKKNSAYNVFGARYAPTFETGAKKYRKEKFDIKRIKR